MLTIFNIINKKNIYTQYKDIYKLVDCYWLIYFLRQIYENIFYWFIHVYIMRLVNETSTMITMKIINLFLLLYGWSYRIIINWACFILYIYSLIKIEEFTVERLNRKKSSKNVSLFWVWIKEKRDHSVSLFRISDF